MFKSLTLYINPHYSVGSVNLYVYFTSVQQLNKKGT